MPLYIYTPANSRLAGASFSSAGARRFLVFFPSRQTATNNAAVTTAANVTPPPFPSFLHHLSLRYYDAYQKKKTADSTSQSTSKKNESTTAGKTVSFHLRLVMRGSAIIFL
jgi:hypothetical protein